MKTPSAIGVDDRVAAGQAAYTPLVLKIYDWLVLGVSNRFLWRCPTAALRDLYAANVSARHLDVGVGTGYYLDKVRWPVAEPEITLLDLNPNSLEAAGKRIARHAPRAMVANALEPLPTQARFDSVGLCYLLHCLPGSIPEKAVVFDHLLAVMSDGAVLFGATLLQGDAPRSRAAQALMNVYNRKGIFSNAEDRFQDLQQELNRRFANVRLRRRGAVAIFEARRRS
ncbi:MAG: class I SAM-dependent methyltransferase [Kiloniellales bacterium]|nr:class I SAM-dependent methyltransferase [Kiloniellales bacterium]